MSSMSLHYKINKFLELLPQLTKNEADTIEDIIGWTDEKKAAFLFAKRIFEEDIAPDSTELKQ